MAIEAEVEEHEILKRSDHDLYKYMCKVTSLYDGDTCRVTMMLGVGVEKTKQRIRWLAIDTPEKHTETKAAGIAARDRVAELTLGKRVIIETRLDSQGEDDEGKFGRLLGTVWGAVDGELVNLNRLLLEEGHALVRTYGDRMPDWAVGFDRFPGDTIHKDDLHHYE